MDFGTGGGKSAGLAVDNLCGSVSCFLDAIGVEIENRFGSGLDASAVNQKIFDYSQSSFLEGKQSSYFDRIASRSQ